MSPEADIYPLGAPDNRLDPDHFHRVLACMVEDLEYPEHETQLVPPAYKSFAQPSLALASASPHGFFGYVVRNDPLYHSAYPNKRRWLDQNPQEAYERLLTAELFPEFRFPTEFCRCMHNAGHPLWGQPFPDHRSLFILALHTPTQIRTLEALIEAFVLGPCDGTIGTVVLCIGQDASRHATTKRWPGLDHQYMRMEYDLRSRGIVMERIQETQPRTYRVHANLRTPLFLR